jgi:hypothetical protein
MYLFYPVAPRPLSGTRILIAEILHRTLRHSQSHAQFYTQN